MVAINSVAIDLAVNIFRILPLLHLRESQFYLARSGISIVAQLRRPWAAQS